MLHNEEKLESLKGILLSLDSVLVAYSGGVDSTLLLRLCQDVLKEKVLAVIGKSPTYPVREMESALAMVKTLSVRYSVIETDELEDQCFVANSADRCYYCKRELFYKLKQIAAKEGLRNIVDGSNYDDLDDYRPGTRAAAEFGVRHPLQEARLTKQEIRKLSREMGLATWEKPSLACLASRFPYGTPVTEKDILIIDEAENYLHNLGIGQLRVRHYGTTARIEVDPEDMPLMFDKENRQRILRYFKGLGYRYITLDLAGYRSGSMNEGLNL